MNSIEFTHAELELMAEAVEVLFRMHDDYSEIERRTRWDLAHKIEQALE